MSQELTFQGYGAFLQEIKARIQQTQQRAVLAVNQEMLMLYWQIGDEIMRRQKEQKWGAGIINQLARDLQAAFPEMKGFSARNMRYMRAFARTYPDLSIWQAPLAKLSWYHHVTLLDKVADVKQREWYMQAAIQYGWSRNVLVHQIEAKLYERQGAAITNFAQTLPPMQSDLAQQTLKDPYIFDFLQLGLAAQERDLEHGLLHYLRDFLLELGVGFAFVGNQYHLDVGGQDFYLDLLLYHLRLRCFVVIDLKIGDFIPEYAGKMNFYLAAVDEQLRHPDDQPTIGIILCKGRNRLIAEYTLRNIQTPMGVATYHLTEALPENFRGQLPTVAEIEAKLQGAPQAFDDDEDEG